MTGRTRDRTVTLPGGSCERYRRSDNVLINTATPSTKPTIKNINVDRVGEGRFRSLTITKRSHVTSPLLNGRANDTFSSNYAVYKDFFPGNFGCDSNISNPAPSIPGLMSMSAAAAKLLAITNPSQPYYDLPLFVYELRELPDLFRREGGSIIKNAAGSNLQLQFGWAPLIADIKRILNFQDACDKRFKELQALRDGGIRRKRTLERASNYTFDSLVNVASGNPNLYVSTVSKHSADTWGYVEWFPNRDFPKSDAELWNKAHKLVSGVAGLSWQTAWNAIPWSWLVDWFANFDDLLGATRNHLPVSHRNLVIMRHSVCETICTPADQVGRWPKDFKGLKSVHEIKTRTPATPGLQLAGLNVLDSRQVSILGSLAILRRPNRSYIKNG